MSQLSIITDQPSFLQHESIRYTLYIYVDTTDEDLCNLYNDKIGSHNNKLNTNPFPDSGFDLFTPSEQTMKTDKPNLVDFRIKTAMVKEQNKPSAFYLYPRSSISKTNLRMANNVGIIDSGYRGYLCGMFDTVHHAKSDFICTKYTRLVQICSPTLEPFRIVRVSSEDMLGVTERGEGGFGSTGTSV